MTRESNLHLPDGKRVDLSGRQRKLLARCLRRETQPSATGDAYDRRVSKSLIARGLLEHSEPTALTGTIYLQATVAGKKLFGFCPACERYRPEGQATGAHMVLASGDKPERMCFGEES